MVPRGALNILCLSAATLTSTEAFSRPLPSQRHLAPAFGIDGRLSSFHTKTESEAPSLLQVSTLPDFEPEHDQQDHDVFVSRQPSHHEVQGASPASGSTSSDLLTNQQWGALTSLLVAATAAPYLANHDEVMGVMQHSLQHCASNAWNGYQQVLAAHPIATKGATSATVYTIGDILSQKSTSPADDEEFELDVPRVLRSLIAGGIAHGPLSHVWYNLSEGFFNNVLHIKQEWWSFLPKIVVDQTVWGPIWNSLYIFLIGIMQRQSFDKLTDDVKSSTLPLLVSGLKLWPLAHVVTYGVLPVEHRLLWVDMVEIVWVSIMASQAAALGDDGEHHQQQQNAEQPSPAVVTP